MKSHIPQELDIEIASSEVGDSMGLETKMCQLIQKSTTLSPSETQFQDFPLQENFRIQPLSILQTPSISSPPAKILKARGRQKASKIKSEIVAGIQTTLDDRFNVVRRSTRRTRCSPCQQ